MDGQRFAGMPGDSAITRGDQIRKRNVYCRRRTRLSSFSEIVHPRGIICMVPEKHIPSSVEQKIRMAIVQN